MLLNKTTIIHSFPTWLPPTQTWMYNLVKYIPDSIENHIVCQRTKNLDQFYLPNIHSLADESVLQLIWELVLRKLKIQKHSPFLLKQANKYKAQILHSHFGQFGWLNLANAQKLKLKHIVTFYGYDVNCIPKREPIWLKRYSELFERVSCVLCEGSHMAQCIINLGCPEDKIRVQHLGVNVKEITYKPRELKKNEPLRVLIAASFVEKKGIPYAIEALGQIKNDIALEITIIGDASNSNPKSRKIQSKSEKQKILEAIDKYKLSSQIKMLGYQPYSVFFEEAYKNHIFLSPSITASDGDTEGGAPVSIIEMAATGMPIISTTHCDIPEVVKHGNTGLLAPEKDSDTLAEYLRWYINHPHKWQEMLDAGRKHIETEYDLKIQGEKLAKIYQEVFES